VISNVPGVKGLERASNAGIASLVINHKGFATREEFEEAIHQALVQASIDIVCLAGFMRILTPYLVERWRGKIINTHPALLPLFKGKQECPRGGPSLPCVSSYFSAFLTILTTLFKAHMPKNLPSRRA
jgi:folate-dependent phosphoribosylglycinamide formyltransferase PurN